MLNQRTFNPFFAAALSSIARLRFSHASPNGSRRWGASPPRGAAASARTTADQARAETPMYA